MPAWHDEDVGRGSRRDVAEGDHQVVGVDLGRGDPAGHDPAEEAVGDGRLGRGRVAHHSIGFVLMSQPIAPTRSAIAYDT